MSGLSRAFLSKSFILCIFLLIFELLPNSLYFCNASFKLQYLLIYFHSTSFSVLRSFFPSYWSLIVLLLYIPASVWYRFPTGINLYWSYCFNMELEWLLFDSYYRYLNRTFDCLLSCSCSSSISSLFGGNYLLQYLGSGGLLVYLVILFFCKVFIYLEYLEVLAYLEVFLMISSLKKIRHKIFGGFMLLWRYISYIRNVNLIILLYQRTFFQLD